MKNLTKTQTAVIILAVVMTVLSFTNLLNLQINGEALKLAGLSVIVGIIAYFTTRKANENKNDGFNIKTFIGALKDKKVILLILLLLAITVVRFPLEKIYLPEYTEHLRARAEDFLDFANLPKLLLELIVFALGEEIAWRAFFQKQTSKIMPFVPSLILTSVLFSLGHFNFGSPFIVLYDLFSVFVDSIFYGIIFRKTDNAWCSFLAHFLANLLGTVMYLL